MRLINYFPHASIVIKKSAVDWVQAIDFSMESLLRNKYVNTEYIQAIKESTLNNGPYYILAPYVAMPHAHPEFGALKTGMSLADSTPKCNAKPPILALQTPQTVA